jgi:hypothetical protein
VPCVVGRPSPCLLIACMLACLACSAPCTHRTRPRSPGGGGGEGDGLPQRHAERAVGGTAICGCKRAREIGTIWLCTDGDEATAGVGSFAWAAAPSRWGAGWGTLAGPFLGAVSTGDPSLQWSAARSSRHVLSCKAWHEAFLLSCRALLALGHRLRSRGEEWVARAVQAEG